MYTIVDLKGFILRQVIDDAKRYEGSHPAGLESRLRPINTKLPRFLDEQRDGIGRESTSMSMSLGRGHESEKHAPSSLQQSPMQRQKQQLEATSKTTRGHGRQRSRSEGEAEQLIRYWLSFYLVEVNSLSFKWGGDGWTEGQSKVISFLLSCVY